MKPTCLEAGCPYAAKGIAGKCSKAAGSLTNLEITRLVAAGGVKSVLLEGMNYLLGDIGIERLI